MSIQTPEDMAGMVKASKAVAETLKAMREYARPGMSTKTLDDYGYELLKSFNALSAPKVTYNFPGWTCISINNVAAHGIPSDQVIMKDGDLINIDVSAQVDGYFSDNGGSFVMGEDINKYGNLVESSRRILYKAIHQIKGGVKIADIGRVIETEAKKDGFAVIKNLTGHGIGRNLHEEPHHIACYYDKYNQQRFRKNTVVAIETFISTKATYVAEQPDGWTLMAKDGSFVAQHEHTILVTDGAPIILTEANGIFL